MGDSGEDLGNAGVQPFTGSGEVVANLDPHGNCLFRCMEGLGEMYTTQMEAKTGQKIDAAYQARNY